MKMLMCKNCCGYKYRNLLTCLYCFESCSDCNFSLSESNVTANKTVHWYCAFHISFNIFSCFCLIHCIFIHERCFKFFLPMRIDRKLKTRLRLTHCIKFYQFPSYVLYTLLGFLLLLLPFTRTQSTECRF